MLHFEPYCQRKKFLHALARRVCLKEFYGDVYILHNKKMGKEKTALTDLINPLYFDTY